MKLHTDSALGGGENVQTYLKIFDAIMKISKSAKEFFFKTLLVFDKNVTNFKRGRILKYI